MSEVRYPDITVDEIIRKIHERNHNMEVVSRNRHEFPNAEFLSPYELYPKDKVDAAYKKMKQDRVNDLKFTIIKLQKELDRLETNEI